MSAVDVKRAKVRVSKNRKKSWRKHCDIKDVEDFLEDQRLDERIGGPVHEKSNEELFFVDTSKELAKPKKTSKTLRCHQSLNAYSQVPPPVNPQKRPLGKKKQEIQLKDEEKKLQKIVSKSSLKRQKTSSQQFHDLWGDEKKENDPDIEDLINYRDEITKKRPVKIPSHLFQKPSLLPAVEVPHPGASYNPSYFEHQELLSKAVQDEQKKLKEELHLKRVLFDMFPTKAEAPTEETRLKEMAQGLFDDEEKGTPDDEADNAELLANLPITDEKRKSKSKRRKKMELRTQNRLRNLEKQKKRNLNDVYRIKSIKAEIRKAEKISAERHIKKQQREVEKMYKPRTLSRYKYQPSDLEVNLSEELPESMRVLKAEGNLFEDRYRSLQRRNIIEPRIKQKRKRKYKLKVQVKRSHRDFK